MQPGWSYADSTRASDAERADVCSILDNAYTDGELDGDEHRQRCATAMSAKTRGELLALLSDLQVRSPSTPVKVNPGRTWIIAGSAAIVVAVAALVSVIVMWHSGSSPSPAAALSAPTAAVAAPTETFSSDATRGTSATAGGFLAQLDVVGTVSGDFQDDLGHPPQHVSCPGDLDAHVGAFERCSITDNDKNYTADVTVTAVKDGRITTHETINEVVPPSPGPGAPPPPN